MYINAGVGWSCGRPSPSPNESGRQTSLENALLQEIRLAGLWHRNNFANYYYSENLTVPTELCHLKWH